MTPSNTWQDRARDIDVKHNQLEAIEQYTTTSTPRNNIPRIMRSQRRSISATPSSIMIQRPWYFIMCGSGGWLQAISRASVVQKREKEKKGGQKGQPRERTSGTQHRTQPGLDSRWLGRRSPECGVEPSSPQQVWSFPVSTLGCGSMEHQWNPLVTFIFLALAAKELSKAHVEPGECFDLCDP
jgi:hypothetical protein